MNSVYSERNFHEIIQIKMLTLESSLFTAFPLEEGTVKTIQILFSQTRDLL